MNSGMSIGNDGSFNEQAAVDEAAKVEAAKQELVDERAGENGELIMGKYGSQEELIDAFKSLQGEYSRLKGSSTPAQSEPAQPEQSEPEPQPQFQQQESGGVTPQQAEQVIEAIFRQTGGEQKYHAMASWAAKNVGDESVQAFNEAIQSGDVNRAVAAVKGLQYDYMTQTGYEPRLIGGRAPASEGPKGYSSEAQVVAAMADPRYQNGPTQDPAYVAEVEARLAASNVFSS
jgi:hypothetical protein